MSARRLSFNPPFFLTYIFLHTYVVTGVFHSHSVEPAVSSDLDREYLQQNRSLSEISDSARNQGGNSMIRKRRSHKLESTSTRQSLLAGDQRTQAVVPEDDAISSRTAFFVCSVLVCVMLVAMLKLSDCIRSPAFCIRSEERLADELVKTKEEAETLARKLAESRSLLDEEGHLSRSEQPVGSLQDCERAFEDAEKAAEEAAEEATAQVEAALKNAEAALKKAERVKAVFEKESVGIKSRAEHFAQNEFDGMLKTMSDVMKAVPETMPTSMAEGFAQVENLQGTAVEAEAKDGDDVNADKLEPIPVALILAGAFAPMKLNSISSNAGFNMFWNFALAVAAGIIYWLDSDKKCDDVYVWDWILGLMALSAPNCFACALLKYWADAALTQLEEDNRDIQGKAIKTGNSMVDNFAEAYNGITFMYNALTRCDDLTNSWVVSLSKWMNFMITIWGAYGLWVSVHDVVGDSESCEVKSVLWFLKIYSFVYLLTLSWTLLNLVIWLIVSFARSTIVQSIILKLARQCDRDSPVQAPLYQTLVRAFVLRDESGLARARKIVIQQDVQKLEKHLQEAKDKLRKEKHEQDLLAEIAQEHSGIPEDDQINKYEEKLRNVLKSAEPVVTVIASMDQDALTKMQQKTVQAAEKARAKAEAARQAARRTAEDPSSTIDETSAVGAAQRATGADVAEQAPEAVQQTAEDPSSAIDEYSAVGTAEDDESVVC